MEVYKSKGVAAVEYFYGPLLRVNRPKTIISTHLEQLASKLWEGIQAKDSIVHFEISNYHPEYLGIDPTSLWQQNLDRTDATLTIAKEYGFESWAAVKTLGDKHYNVSFEIAVDYLLDGEWNLLDNHLEAHPELTTQRSDYAHQATLLHYTASNGVEMWRQKVPKNLPKMTLLLLESGADKNAKMKVYGGEYTTLTLLDTSAHPFDAGVAPAMLKLLQA